MKKWLTQVLLLLLVAGLGNPVYADGIVAIAEINSSPVNFDGKEVKLKGIPKTPTRLPLVNLKAYVLEDKSGEVTILTAAELPRMGEEIIIRAKVESLAIIQGESLGMTVTELERFERQQKI
jgi:hypothetical protein